jgi:glycerol-3-phosphate cytidylyltransferase
MIRIGYAPGAYDLFHIGHLNLLRCAKERCDFLIAGVVADNVLIRHKKVTPVIPEADRLEIVRNIRFVDMARLAMTNDKTEIWKELRFNVLFKGDDWSGTEKGRALEHDFAALGVEVVYFPYTQGTSSSALRRTIAPSANYRRPSAEIAVRRVFRGNRVSGTVERENTPDLKASIGV